MLNEKFNKSEESAIRAIIKKELTKNNDSVQKDIQKDLKQDLKKNKEDIEKNILKNKDLEDFIENVVREMLQSYHDLFYRERHIITHRVKRK
tara:strand:- start:288 stop:563 length:276 start_codon:yes stop_codon:yes gene_type:complete